MSTTFNVTMDAQDMEGKTVLVFLKPVDPQRNYQIHAWQVLDAKPDTTESFQYDSTISTNINSTAQKRQATSNTLEVQPGQILAAVDSDGLSPRLEMAPALQTKAKMTATQARLINQTPDPIDCHWMVDGKPVVTMPQIDAEKACAFEYEPDVYFMVASPPMIGQTYIVQNFTDMTKYTPPDDAGTVQVRVSKDQGGWRFEFDAE